MGATFTADDFGLTRGISENILEAVDQGCLTSVSIIANGYDFEFGISEIKKRPSLQLSVHLNLVEGAPLAPPSDIPSLVDSNGRLHNSFTSLWKKFLFSNWAGRQALRGQIKKELGLQIQRVVSSFPAGFRVNLDSHQHLHLVPFIGDVVVELAKEYKVNRVRVPREPLFSPGSDWLNVRPPNIIKHFLLNSLSKRLSANLNKAGVAGNRYFVGVLFTGRMSKSIVRRATRALPKNVSLDEVEILFHPGGARAGEESYWSANPELRDYYFSPFRARERAELKEISASDISRP